MYKWQFRSVPGRNPTQDPVNSHRILPRILNGNNPNHVLQDPTQDPVKSFRILLKIVWDPVEDPIGSCLGSCRIL